MVAKKANMYRDASASVGVEFVSQLRISRHAAQF
jgi:hypothetical protein